MLFAIFEKKRQWMQYLIKIIFVLYLETFLFFFILALMMFILTQMILLEAVISDLDLRLPE